MFGIYIFFYSSMLSLNLFLKAHALHQYLDSFEKAGATDGDLDQLLQFNDGELGEFLRAIDMLPFHAIKLKRCLRELKAQNTHRQTGDPSIFILPSSNSMSLQPVDDISSRAIIFGKKAIRPISAYQDAINQAAIKLALNNPTLLLHKGYLFELSKKKLIEDGYSYKRGKSRSKYNTAKSTNNPCSMPNKLVQINHKRKENAEQASKERIERLKDIQDTLKANFLEEQRQTALLRYASHYNNQETKKAAENELENLKNNRKSLKKDLYKLKAQERKHQWYKKRQISHTFPCVQNMISFGPDE
ncbi:hypothetical protein CLU79DRAFT_703062 [Phycomyces nitens]|nr:hypothetical protein CLU79DRAFT_703062 [Phycomyces nitens]